MAYISGRGIWPELGEALGLTGHHIRRLQIDVQPNEAVTMTVEYVTKEQMKAIAGVLRRYQLVPMDEDSHAESPEDSPTTSNAEQTD